MKNCQNSENYGNRTTKEYIELKEKVRYSETDQMGVAHNKSYFEWFELGRTEFLRQKNLPYRNIEALGYYLAVVEAHCKYKKPLRYDDVFLIRVALEELAPKKVVFGYDLLMEDGQTLVASGQTVHIVTNRDSKVCSLPGEIVEKIRS